MHVERRPYRISKDDWAHKDFTRRLEARIDDMRGGTICELGGGARPALGLDFLDARNLDCLVVDVSASELEKAPAGYNKLVGDVSSESFELGGWSGGCDLVFSRVLAEHVRDARQFHANIHSLLKPGGVAMHFFPTLWWPPFVLNRLLPERLAERLLLAVTPDRARTGTRGKFPAFYHWCFGPTEAQRKRFASVGFEVEQAIAYFGEPTHAPGSALKALDRRLTSRMMRSPNYNLTSYATYVLRRAS